jgi:hypothetical protein
MSFDRGNRRRRRWKWWWLWLLRIPLLLFNVYCLTLRSPDMSNNVAFSEFCSVDDDVFGEWMVVPYAYSRR